MIYLLDVDALLALGCDRHVHHVRVEHWITAQKSFASGSLRLATCAITELGFIRIASGKTAVLPDLTVALAELRQLKARGLFVFLGDRLSAERLPAWVKKPSQTTDGHLLDLAMAHNARLATLDTGIPGAELIPEYPPRWSVEEPAAQYGRAA